MTPLKWLHYLILNNFTRKNLELQKCSENDRFSADVGEGTGIIIKLLAGDNTCKGESVFSRRRKKRLFLFLELTFSFRLYKIKTLEGFPFFLLKGFFCSGFVTFFVSVGLLIFWCFLIFCGKYLEGFPFV